MNNPSGAILADTVFKFNVAQAKNSQAQILPYSVTATNTFTVASAVTQITNVIDASYHFAVQGIIVWQQASATNLDTFLTAIQVNSTSNYLQGNLPFQMISQFTGVLMPFNLFVPANNNLQTTIQNGSTTAANIVYVTYWGIKIPEGIDVSQFLK